MAKEIEGKTIIAPEHAAEDQYDEDAGFFTAQQKKKSRKLFFVMGGLVAIALILIVAIGIWLMSNRTVAVIGCSVDQLKTAKAAIAGKDKTALSRVTGEIKKNKQYAQDVNCLYVVAADDTFQGRTDQSLLSLNAFYEKYDERVGLSKNVSNDSAADVRMITKMKSDLRAKTDPIQTSSEDLL